MSGEPWNLTPLAKAVLADRSAPPRLVLAAWHYLYGWETDELPSLVTDALAAPAVGVPEREQT